MQSQHFHETKNEFAFLPLKCNKREVFCKHHNMGTIKTAATATYMIQQTLISNNPTFYIAFNQIKYAMLLMSKTNNTGLHRQLDITFKTPKSNFPTNFFFFKTNSLSDNCGRNPQLENQPINPGRTRQNKNKRRKERKREEKKGFWKEGGHLRYALMMRRRDLTSRASSALVKRRGEWPSDIATTFLPSFRPMPSYFSSTLLQIYMFFSF